MHFISFDRGIVVAVCFFLWLGAAGLVCWALVPVQVPDEPLTFTSAVSVAHPTAAPSAGATQLTMAQR
jgi:hypothetical protein